MFFKRKKEKVKIYVPTLEEVIEHCYDQGFSAFSDKVVKAIYNSTKTHRVVILIRPCGTYRIVEEELIRCDEDDLYCNPDIWGFWNTYDRGTSIFDSVESAEEEAIRLISIT